MSDDRVRTFVHTDAGPSALPAAIWCATGAAARVRRIEIAGAARARPAPGVLAAIRRPARS